MGEDNNKSEQDNLKQNSKKKVLIRKSVSKVVVKRAGSSNGEEKLQSFSSNNKGEHKEGDKPHFSTNHKPSFSRPREGSSFGSPKPTVSARPSFARPTAMAGKLEENIPVDRSSGGFNRDSRPSGGRGGFNRGGGFNKDASDNRGSQGGRGGFNRNSSSKSEAPALPAGGLDKKAMQRKYHGKKESNFRYGRNNEEENAAFLQYKRKKAESGTSVPKSITMMENITIADLAKKMNLKASDLIGKLFTMGMMVTINQVVDSDTASLLAGEYGCEVQVLSLYEETVIVTEEDKPEDLSLRPPIVTIMGHVDHGKTKLLDTIHSLDVIAGESGGITQHIGAYTIETSNGAITFLDTPGHEAFTMMRARGAQVTDIVVLVVAADDGVMPQTVEAINHAQDADVPIIVVINKIDLPTANPDRIKQQLSDYKLMPEEWGGTTAYVEVSAKQGIGIENLLEAILLQAEIMEIKANPNKRASGHVLEAKIDPGRGVVCTVMVQEGTLKVGDPFVVGVYPGKVRALFDWRGQKIQQASPSVPVEILGFDGLPEAGDPFQATENEKMARSISEKRQELKRQDNFKHMKKASLATLYDQKEAENQQEFKVIIKGDVQGSVEALKVSLEKLSTPEILLRVILASAGAITESDVDFAMAAGAVIIGFHVRPTSKAQVVADNNNVEILRFNIIYDAIESVRSAMEGMLEPELQQQDIGEVEVRKLFKVPKIGVIAGCYVTNGLVKRTAMVRVMRNGVLIHEGKISSLRREKDEAKEVAYSYECGIGLENFQDLQEGDIFEVYEIHKVAKKL